jgi:hypothetical protein
VTIFVVVIGISWGVVVLIPVCKDTLSFLRSERFRPCRLHILTCSVGVVATSVILLPLCLYLCLSLSLSLSLSLCLRLCLCLRALFVLHDLLLYGFDAMLWPVSYLSMPVSMSLFVMSVVPCPLFRFCYRSSAVFCLRSSLVASRSEKRNARRENGKG